MRLLAFAVVGLATATVAADDPPKAVLRDLLPVEDQIPDPDAKAETGRQLSIEKDGAPACRSTLHFDHYMKSLVAGDRVGMDRLLNDKGVVKLTKGTRVLVLRNLRPIPPQQTARVGLSGAQVGRAIQEAILNGSADTTDYPVEVRILDGEKKNQTALVPESFIAPLMTRPIPRGFIRIIPGEAYRSGEGFERPRLNVDGNRGKTDPVLRAATMLRTAQKLQDRGDVVGAVGAYWFTMMDFRDLPQAEIAAQKLKAMGFSRRPDGSYLLDPPTRGRPKKGSRKR